MYTDPKTGIVYTSPEVAKQYGVDIGTATSGVPIQTQQMQAYQAQPQPQVTPPGQPTPTPTPNTTPTPPATGSNQYALAQVMQQLDTQYKTNNSLMTNRNIALNALYGMPVSPEDMAKLDPTLRQVLQSGDKNQIEMQIRLINDQVSGRANTLDQSMQFLVQSYSDQQKQLEQNRQDAINTVRDFVTTYGSNAKSALTSLYGQDYVNQLSQMGINVDQLANVPSIAQQTAGIPVTPELGQATGNYLGLPIYDTKKSNPTLNIPTRDNNPGDITATDFSKSLPGVVGVEQTADGRKFLIFDSPQSGMNAVKQLLQTGKTYQNSTAEQAMRAYSGGGYGAADVGLNPTQSFKQQISDPAVLDSVVQAIAQREGFSGAGAGGTAGTGLTQQAIDLAAQQYLTTGQMPSLGLGSAPQVRAARTAILNRAAELGAGTIPGINKAQLTSLTSTLTDQTKYANNMERSVNTVDANIKILQDAASKVSNYSSPLLNEWQRLVQQKVIGSGDLNSYQTALQTVRTEYATLLGRGTPTDQTRTEAATLIPDNISRSQLDQVIGTIQQEGQNVVNQANAQVDSVQTQMQQLLTGGSNPTPTPTSGGSFEDYLKIIGQ